MSTLLLRFAAPLQAWGAASRFNRRLTEQEPTKSGVIGFIAAALGRRRTDKIDDLCTLRYGVRLDQPGSLVRDYHTARHPSDKKRVFISERYYLADAIFLVGLEGEEELLRNIDHAVQNPAFPLFLGRRSCPPVGQLSLGIKAVSLEEALKNEKWLAASWYKKRHSAHEQHLEIVRDAMEGESAVFGVRDNPVSFDQKHRRFTFRGTVRYSNSHFLTSHPPFAEMEGE